MNAINPLHTSQAGRCDSTAEERGASPKKQHSSGMRMHACCFCMMTTCRLWEMFALFGRHKERTASSPATLPCNYLNP